MHTNTDIATRLTIPELVREFDLGMHELKQGLALVKQLNMIGGKGLPTA